MQAEHRHHEEEAKRWANWKPDYCQLCTSYPGKPGRKYICCVRIFYSFLCICLVLIGQDAYFLPQPNCKIWWPKICFSTFRHKFDGIFMCQYCVQYCCVRSNSQSEGQNCLCWRPQKVHNHTEIYISGIYSIWAGRLALVFNFHEKNRYLWCNDPTLFFHYMKESQRLSNKVKSERQKSQFADTFLLLGATQTSLGKQGLWYLPAPWDAQSWFSLERSPPTN